MSGREGCGAEEGKPGGFESLGLVSGGYVSEFSLTMGCPGPSLCDKVWF